MKTFILALLVLAPSLAFAECRVIDYGDRTEVVCEDVPAPEQPKPDVSSVYDKCKKEISWMLKSPSSAIYQPSGEKPEIQEIDGKRYMPVDVDSQNSYGGMMRKRFLCVVDEDNNIVRAF